MTAPSAASSRATLEELRALHFLFEVQRALYREGVFSAASPPLATCMRRFGRGVDAAALLTLAAERRLRLPADAETFGLPRVVDAHVLAERHLDARWPFTIP